MGKIKVLRRSFIYFNKGKYIISVLILLIATIETARANNGFSVSQKLHERLIQFLTPEILRRN